ncbi:MAG: outer membrane lipoprotein-sorting protein, partial [Spirochaetes bacterium]|nr:outer membrane lipoprotein-sorting protein [Spirochaetota bacterium]
DGVGTFIEITAPARSRGIRFLSKEENLWLYNPRSNSRRAIRLSPRDSFQGTLFSNHDVGDPQYTDDYEARQLQDEGINHPQMGAVETRVIEALPTTDEAPYGRIKMWLRAEDLIPVQMEYYARSGLLFKRMYLSNITELAGAHRPAVMRMESLQLQNAFSRVEILTLEERTDLSDRRFTEANLTR